MDKKEESGDGDGEQPFNNEPSSLDENTHAEMCMLYSESARTIRFAKRLQWWTVGSTLLTFGGLVVIAKLVSVDKDYASQMVAVIILLTVAVIFTLVIHQFWQYTELTKIEEIDKNLSTLFAKVRKIKSNSEANISRYILLIFMIMSVIIGAAVAYLAIKRLLMHG